MASFVATYTGPTGQPKSLTIKAGDLTEARRQLRRRGIRAIELKPAEQDTTSGDVNNAAGLRSIDLNKLFEQPPGVKDKAVSPEISCPC